MATKDLTIAKKSPQIGEVICDKSAISMLNISVAELLVKLFQLTIQYQDKLLNFEAVIGTALPSKFEKIGVNSK